MPDKSFAKLLIIIGTLIILTGVIFYFGNPQKLFGKLPGDILIKKNNITLYFPLATSVIISVVFSIVLYILSKTR